MIDKQRLKNQQPVAWQILSNALRHDAISHAYLFHGPRGPAKTQMALLFTQSMVCEHPDEDGFACQQCEACQQMEKEESSDFFWLHPGSYRARKPLSKAELAKWWKNQSQTVDERKNWVIKKDDILRLQDAFAASAATGRRQIYILEGYDKATSQASNSLLKFLEEPKEGLTGILTADGLNAILPTIVSRCQLIPFRPPAKAALADELKEHIEDEEICAILANAGWDWEMAKDLLEDEALFTLRDEAQKWWENRKSLAALAELQIRLFSKTKKPSRKGMEFFLSCLLYFVMQEPLDEKHLQEREILLEHLDALKYPVDVSLLMDRLAFEIEKSDRTL